MYESPDNPASKPDIDGLFQKLAQDYEPPFDPAAWPQMQQQLDQHQPQPYALARQLLLLLAVLFIIGSQFQSGRGSKLEPSMASVVLANQPCQPDATTKTTDNRPQSEAVATVTRRPGQPEPVAKITGTPTAYSEPVGRSTVEVAPNQLAASTQPSVTLPQRLAGQPSINRSTLRRRPALASATSAPGASTPTTGMRRLPLVQKAILDKSPAESPNQLNVAIGQPPKQRRLPNQRKDAELSTRPDRQLARQQRPNPVNALTNPGLSNAGSVPTLPPTRARNPETADAIPPAERTNLPTQPESRSMAAVSTSVVDLPKSTDSLASIRPVALPAPTVLAKPDSTMVVAPVVQTDTVAQTDSKPVTSKPIRQNGLSFLVLVSPDLTTVGLTNFAQPGTNYGLMAEYRFSRRWSVQTGVIRSTKIYNALSSQYKYPSTWKLDVPFESVAGRCQMLDLPLNVRFDVLTGKRPVTSNGAVPRLFVSAGVTTYIMLSEVYNYIYENPSDPRIVFWKWQGKTGRYNFSQVNVSMGYERPISGKWSVQAEPFIKIPIEQVGFFKIRLISTGVFLGLRYKL